MRSRVRYRVFLFSSLCLTALLGAARKPSFADQTAAVPTALPGAFAYGVASGDITSSSAILWTRTPGAFSITAELSLSQTFNKPFSLPAITSSADADFTIKVLADNLTAGTIYYYRFHAGGATSAVGTFKTAYADDQDAPVTMAFTGDADWKWKPYPLLTSLVKENLDFFVFLGDLLYETTNLSGSTSVEDLAGYRWKYRENREPRDGSPSQIVPMKDLYANFGQYSVFDNHETGLSKTDRTAPSYNEGGSQTNGTFANQSQGFKDRIQAYREYQPVDANLITKTADLRQLQTYQFFHAIRWGANLTLFVVDDRSYRDSRLANADDPATASCARTMLGIGQLNWLEDSLLAAQQAKTTWKLVAISSPIQQLGTTAEVGNDQDSTKSWPGDYACERNKLLGFIDQNKIDNVVFITTDNHYTVINNLMYNTTPDDLKSPLKPARNAIEILTGPIGAGPGNPTSKLRVDTTGLSPRDADRKALAVWNGDQPNIDGKMKGLRQVGLDPIGLQDYPGLMADSVSALGIPAGTIEAANFASLNTFAYAVLNFDKSSLTVTVKGIPAIADAQSLIGPDVLKHYEDSQTQQILTFKIRAN